MKINNVQKMREVLIKAKERIAETRGFYDGDADEEDYNALMREIDAYIALPLRQCDVGSISEQRDRFINFCSKFRESGCFDCNDVPLCPVAGECDCKIAWGQMPYDSERAANDSD